MLGLGFSSESALQFSDRAFDPCRTCTNHFAFKILPRVHSHLIYPRCHDKGESVAIMLCVCHNVICILCRLLSVIIAITTFETKNSDIKITLCFGRRRVVVGGSFGLSSCVQWAHKVNSRLI